MFVGNSVPLHLRRLSRAECQDRIRTLWVPHVTPGSGGWVLVGVAVLQTSGSWRSHHPSLTQYSQDPFLLEELGNNQQRSNASFVETSRN
jgi:hypothetical protein